MKIVMLNGQNHKGSTYHIGRMIADRGSFKADSFRNADNGVIIKE